MAKTLIGINVLESVNGHAYASHVKFFSNLKVDHPNDQFVLFTPYRMAIDTMRNNSMKIALDTNCDYVMFIDDDMLLERNTYTLLKEADKDIIMALTYIRGYPFAPMFFRALGIVDNNGIRQEGMKTFDEFKDLDESTGKQLYIDDKGLVKCAAVGFACTLIKTELIRAIGVPWCLTGPNHTEDVYFCNKARYTLEPEPEIYVHTKCPTMHIMMADGVSDHNVDKLRQFYGKDTPLGKSREDRIQNVINKLSEPSEVI